MRGISNVSASVDVSEMLDKEDEGFGMMVCCSMWVDKDKMELVDMNSVAGRSPSSQGIGNAGWSKITESQVSKNGVAGSGTLGNGLAMSK